MRNFAAFIGLAIGGYLGLLFGTVVDGYAAWITETHPAHTYTAVMTLVMASVFAYSFRQVVGGLIARRAVAVAKVERAEMKASPTRARTGRTPPSPFPAFQA
jgi:anaerobic C4-dicarboxylate transporter